MHDAKESVSRQSKATLLSMLLKIGGKYSYTFINPLAPAAKPPWMKNGIPLKNSNLFNSEIKGPKTIISNTLL